MPKRRRSRREKDSRFPAGRGLCAEPVRLLPERHGAVRSQNLCGVPRELIEEYLAEQKVFTTGTYYGMSDGTWKTDEYAYPHMLEITGRLPGAQRDSTYVILSSRDDITFEEAWKASGLSSNTEDYFRREDAVFVGLG